MDSAVVLRNECCHAITFPRFNSPQQMVSVVIFEPVFERAYFGTDFASIRSNKFAARYFWFSETEAKEIHLKIVSGNLYLEDKNRPILIFSQRSSVVS